MQKKELQKTIEDFSKALEQGHAAVYRRNFDSATYEYMGGYIEEITGYGADELTPELWDELILETEQEGELAGLSLEDANHKVRTGEVERWQADVKIRTHSGGERWVSDMSTVLRDESGVCFGCLGVLLDITDRKEAEKELADLTQKLRERNQQMDDELAMAREVQQALISDEPARFPAGGSDDRPQVDFYHRYIPTEMLGGDFFDILPLSEREVGVFICDVVGHGVRAALLTTFLRGLIEELVPFANDPGTILSKINQSLRAVFCRADTVIFATAFYLVLDISTGRVRYANAGHSHPLCLQPEAGNVAWLRCEEQDRGPALGIVGDFTYRTMDRVLASGESLLMYTDGLFEVYNANGEMYGEKRVLDSVRQQMHLPPEQRMDGIIGDVLRFSSSDLFEDDVCLLAVVPAST